jgi:hypothetical protein
MDAGGRQGVIARITTTITDSLLIQTFKCATSKDLWNATCTEHERMILGWSNVYNQRRAGVGDVRETLLAAACETLEDDDFAFALTKSLPESCGDALRTAYIAAKTNGQITVSIQQIKMLGKLERKAIITEQLLFRLINLWTWSENGPSRSPEP